MFTERTSVGLDVHARSVATAAIDGVTGELRQSRLTPSHGQIVDWLRDLPGPVAVAYEAGPTGFGLSRALNAAGIRCVVVAPSKLQRPAGDRVKTVPRTREVPPAKDAVHLSRLLRLDEVTAVAVPTLQQEAARDLVRAREDARGDLMRARHRLSKLLLRHGLVYSGGKAWSQAHDAWLRHVGREDFSAPASRVTSARTAPSQRTASSNSSTGCHALRWVPWWICWRQETPVAAITASAGAARTAGKSRSSPTVREMS